MEIKVSKKYIFSLLVTILGILGLISGASYAILKGSTESSNVQIIKAGSVQLQLEEKYNDIEIGSYVLKDTDGLMQDETYEFTITNIGSIPAKYDLKLLNEAPSGQTALSSSYIRIGLEVNGEEMGPMGLANVNNIIDSNTINEDEVVRYKMRIWLDKTKKDQIEENSSKKAYLSLKVEAKQSAHDITKDYVYGIQSLLNYGLGMPLDAGTYNGYCYVDFLNNSCTDNNRGFLIQNDCTNVIGDDTEASCEAGSWTTSGTTYTTDATTLNKQYYYKVKKSANSRISEVYICFVTDSEYCIRGGGIYNSATESWESSYYESNKEVLDTAFGASNCEETTESDTYYACSNNTLNVTAHSDGLIAVGTRQNNTYNVIDIDGGGQMFSLNLHLADIPTLPNDH